MKKTLLTTVGHVPSEEKDEIHPTKEQSDCTHFLLVSYFTITRRENVGDSRHVGSPFQIVRKEEEISLFLKSMNIKRGSCEES